MTYQPKKIVPVHETTYSRWHNFNLTLVTEFLMCNFSIPFTGSATDVLKRAKAAVQSQGGSFDGTTADGVFEVSVFGSAIRGGYTVSGSDLLITISSKPFFIPCNTIETFLKGQIS